MHGTGLLSPAECLGSGSSEAGPMTGHQHVPPGSALVIGTLSMNNSVHMPLPPLHHNSLPVISVGASRTCSLNLCYYMSHPCYHFYPTHSDIPKECNFPNEEITYIVQNNDPRYRTKIKYTYLWLHVFIAIYYKYSVKPSC